MTVEEVKYSYTFALTKYGKVSEIQSVRAKDYADAMRMLEEGGFLEDGIEAKCIKQPPHDSSNLS